MIKYLIAILLTASAAYSQTIKTLGYNTTNGEVAYSGSNILTFTNPLGFSNAATTRTNLGLGASWLTNSNSPATTNATNLTAGTLPDARLSTNVAILSNLPSWATTTNADVARTNLGLGASWLTNTNATNFRSAIGLTLSALTNTNVTNFRTDIGLGSLATNNSVPSFSAATNSILTADGSGGSSFVASRLSVSSLTTNVVRTSWANVGADKPTNDTGLSLTYAAGSVYKLRWSVFVSSTWSNVAYGLAFSSTNSFPTRNGYQVTPQSSTPSGATIAAGVTNITLVSDSTSSYSTPVYVGGEIVFFSTNAGTLNFRFWTSASNTNTSTLLSNSILSLEKIYP